MASQVVQPTDMTLRPGTGIMFTPRQILKTAGSVRGGGKKTCKSFDLGLTPSARGMCICLQSFEFEFTLFHFLFKNTTPRKSEGSEMQNIFRMH